MRKQPVAGALMVLLALLVGSVLLAADGDGGPEVGMPAPAFSLPGTDGETYSLEDLKGKAVVIAWFPKAFTGG